MTVVKPSWWLIPKGIFLLTPFLSTFSLLRNCKRETCLLYSITCYRGCGKCKVCKVFYVILAAFFVIFKKCLKKRNSIITQDVFQLLFFFFTKQYIKESSRSVEINWTLFNSSCLFHILLNHSLVSDIWIVYNVWILETIQLLTSVFCVCISIGQILWNNVFE